MEQSKLKSPEEVLEIFKKYFTNERKFVFLATYIFLPKCIYTGQLLSGFINIDVFLFYICNTLIIHKVSPILLILPVRPKYPKNCIIYTQNIKRQVPPPNFSRNSLSRSVISVVHRRERRLDDTLASSTTSNHCSVR